MAQGVASAPALRHSNHTQGGPSDQDLPQRREPHRHTYGAIDLGTNNCRLLIARPSGSNFVVIKLALGDLPPLLFAALRFTLAALPAVFFLPRPAVPWRNLAAWALFIVTLI